MVFFFFFLFPGEKYCEIVQEQSPISTVMGVSRSFQLTRSTVRALAMALHPRSQKIFSNPVRPPRQKQRSPAHDLLSCFEATSVQSCSGVYDVSHTQHHLERITTLGSAKQVSEKSEEDSFRAGLGTNASHSRSRGVSDSQGCLCLRGKYEVKIQARRKGHRDADRA